MTSLSIQLLKSALLAHIISSALNKLPDIETDWLVQSHLDNDLTGT